MNPDQWQSWDFDVALAPLCLHELGSPDVKGMHLDLLLLFGRAEWTDEQGRPCYATVLGTKEMLTSFPRCKNTV